MRISLKSDDRKKTQRIITSLPLSTEHAGTSCGFDIDLVFHLQKDNYKLVVERFAEINRVHTDTREPVSCPTAKIIDLILLPLIKLI